MLKGFFDKRKQTDEHSKTQYKLLTLTRHSQKELEEYCVSKIHRK